MHDSVEIADLASAVLPFDSYSLAAFGPSVAESSVPATLEPVTSAAETSAAETLVPETSAAATSEGETMLVIVASRAVDIFALAV